MILGKNFRDFKFEDIVRLVDSKISESKTLDYKKEITLDKGDERKEFLYDIASFVNTEGGLIIYGVSEQKDENYQNTGLPEEICGIQCENFDKLLQKMEDLIRSSIEPNIPDIVINHLESDNIHVLIVGLKKIFGIPRMVTYNSTNKFYKRRNTGKYLVDVHELNQMFMENADIYNELNSFRLDRLNKIKIGEYLPDLDAKKVTLLHICPISFFQYNQLPLTDERLLDKLRNNLTPHRLMSRDFRNNFEGFINFSRNNQTQKVNAYNQIFRNGIIEFYSNDFHSDFGDKQLYFLGTLELLVIDWIKSAIMIYKDLEVPPPFLVYLSITGLINHIVDVGNYFRLDVLPFVSNNLYLPNIILNDYDENPEKILKSIFDIIWQAAGERKSPYFDELGNRMKK